MQQPDSPLDVFDRTLGAESHDAPITPAEMIRSKLVTTDQLRGMPRPQPLIDGWLNLDSLAMVYGPSGGGKTHVVMDIANTVSARRFWHANAVTNGGVLYVLAEGAPGASLRVTAWERHHGVTSAVTWHPGAISVFSDAWAAGLAEVVAELRPVLVVIDTYARATVGMEENGTKDTGITVEHLDMIRQAAGSCVLIVHHAGKDVTKGARGNSALKGAMDTEIEVVGGDGRIKVSNTKQKDAPEAAPLHFKLTPVPDTDSVVIEQAGARIEGDDLTAAAFDTLKALRDIDVTEGVSATAWRAAADATERTFYRHRSGLLQHGHVVNIGTDTRPRYRPVDEVEE